MTQALVKKLLHAPTNRLRAEASSPHASEYASVARKLFDLSDHQSHLSSSAADD
jgi:glutamyl-tRNA reductase